MPQTPDAASALEAEFAAALASMTDDQFRRFCRAILVDLEHPEPKKETIQ